MRRLVASVVGVVGIVALAAGPAVAQPAAADREGAAEAYDMGTRLFMRQNWEQAAQMFETADRLAPAAPALAEAIRAHQQAGNELRAASLALRLSGRHPDDDEAQAVAEPVLEAGAPQFFRVDVECDGCSVDVDGALAGWPSFFLEPETEHRVTASFDTGERTETVSGEGGEEQTLTFVAPEASEAADDGGQTPVGDGSDGDSAGLPPVIVLVGAGLTAVAGGVLVWSGVDALAGVDGYEADPTQAALEEGQSKELRTNVLIGVTAGLAAITAALAVFTDWGGDTEQQVRAAMAPIQGGAAALVEGSF